MKPRGEITKPVQETQEVLQVSQKLAVSERRACQVLEQARANQRHKLSLPSDEKQLTADIIALATKYCG